MRRYLLAFVVLALLTAGGQRAGLHVSAPAAQAIDIEAVVWQFGKDYPGAVGDDTKLPVRAVYIKTHDGTDWMSTYDEDPKAVSGPGSVRHLISEYNAQGIEVIAWFVPKSGDVETQVRMAHQVLDAGVKALYADIEPFDGFCYLDCGLLAEHFWQRLRLERPEANLGVIYDPRPWTWADSATEGWLSAANTALPMCYWEDFVDQPPWNDPAGCVGQARADLGILTPGRALEYVPMLQGDSTAERFLAAMDTARATGSTRVSVWRRGVVRTEVWDAAWNVYEPQAQVAADWPSYWQWSPCPWDGCILKEQSSSLMYILYSGAKFPISGPEALAAMGRSEWDYWVVGDGMMSMVADVPWDGTLLSEAGSGAIHMVYAGAKLPVPSFDSLYALGLAAQPVHTVAPGGLSNLPAVPREGAHFQELSGGHWQIAAGAKFALPMQHVIDGLVASGALEGGIYLVPDGALGAIPSSPHNGAHIRELSSPTEYQIALGAKFPLANVVERNKLVHGHHLEWRLSVVPDGALAGIPTAPPEGTRIRELDGEVEWQIAGGMKFKLTDAGRRDALAGAGVLRSELTLVPNGALASIPEGPVEGTLLRQPGSDAVFVLRCGSLYHVKDQAQLARLVEAGLARPPVLAVSGPLDEPDISERSRCASEGGAQACPPSGWGVANPFAPLGCKPQETATSEGPARIPE